MGQPTRQFFDTLAQRIPRQLPREVRGTLRCDLRTGDHIEHWYLTVGEDVAVSHSDAEADCIMRCDTATFDAVVTGRLNAMAAYLRGRIEAKGKVGMLEALQMLVREDGPEGRVVHGTA